MSSYDPAFASAGTSLAPFSAATSSTAASKAARNALPTLVDPKDPTALTPLRAHYLKKTLIKHQLTQELQHLSTKDALSTFGPPFRPSPSARSTDLPLLRYMFQHFVLTFPFLRSAPPNFFADKVQVFVERFLERNISGTDDRTEATKRRRITSKLEKYFVLLLGSAVKVKDGGEEVVRIGDDDRRKISALEARRRAAIGRAEARTGRPDSFHSDSGEMFDINVVSVRTVTTKGRIRNRTHEEFIIRTRPGIGRQDIYVSRRYGDFSRLAESLKLEHPDEDVRSPPPKDRSNTDVTDMYREEGSSSPTRSTATLAREKNRLTLRAYLRSLLAIPFVAESAIFMDFLANEPIVLTRAEEEDVATREGLDHVREEEHRRFAEEASRRVTELQHHLTDFKADLIQRDGLTRIFATIKSTPTIEGLPDKYKALLKWARINLASTLFNIFMGSDTSSEIFAQLKRMHGMVPYFMLRGILRISNPVAMIRGVLDLFLAQPFGQRSLLQRMFSSSLQDEVKELGEICAAISEKVEDEALCEKVRLFVYASPAVQEGLRQEAEAERLDLLTAILRSPAGPTLDRGQIHRVVRASRAYEVYKEYRRGLKSEAEDEGPQDDDAWLYEDLHVLMKMLIRQRDKEQLISLIFEGVTAELLKDMVTIFYAPLAQVYKLANIADSLSDLQAFINDLIRTVEGAEATSYADPQRTVQVFIDLVERHESRFYSFVHQTHAKGAGLFDGLMHWIELFINFVREDGIGKVDLEVCMPAGGAERKKALEEIDALVLYAYRVKFLREVKMRRKLADKEVRGAADKLMGEVDDAAFVKAMVEGLGVTGVFEGEVADAEAEDDEEEEDHEEAEEEEKEPAWRPTPSRQNTLTQASVDKDLPPPPPPGKGKLQPPTPPTLTVIPEMVPLFVEMIRPLLRPARSASASTFSEPSPPPTAQLASTHISEQPDRLPGDYRW